VAEVPTHSTLELPFGGTNGIVVEYLTCLLALNT